MNLKTTSGCGDRHRLKPTPDTPNTLKWVATLTNVLQHVFGISRRIHSAAWRPCGSSMVAGFIA
jgi:hypothetical protein